MPSQSERRAELAAELQRTIDLVTAMFWNLECGENLSLEQIAACRHDHVLGVLWARIWDYAAYRSRTQQLWRTAHSDEVSIYLDYEARQCHADCEALLKGNAPLIWFSDTVRVLALKGHAKARAMRRRYATAARIEARQ